MISEDLRFCLIFKVPEETEKGSGAEKVFEEMAVFSQVGQNTSLQRS